MSNIKRKQLVKLIIRLGGRVSIFYSLTTLMQWSEEALLKEAGILAVLGTEYILKMETLEDTEDIYILIDSILKKVKQLS
jgi:hypothetical protein